MALMNSQSEIYFLVNKHSFDKILTEKILSITAEFQGKKKTISCFFFTQGRKSLTSREIQSATLLGNKTSTLIILLVSLEKLKSVPRPGTKEIEYELMED